jgi:16S rRNA C967 or C1407 C5-methylase (RsmB/RsmF family)
LSPDVKKTISLNLVRHKLPPDFLSFIDGHFSPLAVSAMLKGMSEERPVTCRVNTLKSDAGKVMAFFKSRHILFQRVQWYPDAFVLVGGVREREIESLEIYQKGEI